MTLETEIIAEFNKTFEALDTLESHINNLDDMITKMDEVIKNDN